MAYSDEIVIDEGALEVARKKIEDELIEMRDARMFMICGNGFTVREADGSASAIIRMRTDFGLRIAIKAYLAAVA